MNPAAEASSDIRRNHTTPSDRVVEHTAARAATEVEDVLSAKVNVRMIGRVVDLDVRVTLRYPVSISAATQRVRSHLVARVQELTGTSVSRVDIVITGLETEEESRRRHR